MIFPSLALAALAAGCTRQEPIRVYQVPKPHLVYEANHVEDRGPTGPDGQPVEATDRMLAALVPHDRAAWFFKLVGPKDRVTKHEAEFNALLKSLRFAPDAERPQWTAPAGWKELPASGERFATLTIEAGEKPLEVAVSRLMADDGKDPEYLLRNVNRWRAQMSLRAVNHERMVKETETFSIGDRQAVVVRLDGKFGGGPMPPFAASGMRGTSRPGPANPPRAAAKPAITYTTPAGWREAALDQFSQVALEAGEGAQRVRVTITAAAGDVVQNVNRWRDQLGLPSSSPAEIEKGIVAIDVAGRSGHLAEVVGEEETILGAIVPDAGAVWFIKLRGPNAAAKREKEHFVAFVKSIKF